MSGSGQQPPNKGNSTPPLTRDEPKNAHQLDTKSADVMAVLFNKYNEMMQRGEVPFTGKFLDLTRRQRSEQSASQDDKKPEIPDKQGPKPDDN
jgi:hypothetical protein